jgi:hypothetical protein
LLAIVGGILLVVGVFLYFFRPSIEYAYVDIIETKK